MNNFASLCILAWKRPEKLVSTLKTLHETLDYPAEVIINFDGGDMSALYATNTDYYSKAIINRGENRGIAKAFENCLSLAEGKYIFKVDADLIFYPHWLSKAVECLETHPDVKAVSLFNYRHHDPKDKRFNVLEERDNCFIVDDFVSSIYGFRAEDKEKLLSRISEDGNHLNIGGLLAITKEDYVTTTFGYKESSFVYIDKNGQGQKMGMHDKPLIFGGKDD
jgi:glycosyltransferase involved in cell wall biosynthesis